MRLKEEVKGFTLIELMVTITIIAILATVGFSIYSTAQRTARDGKRIADMQEVQKAMEQYYATNRNYSLSATVYAIAGLDGYFSEGKVPTDPNGGSNYSSEVCSGPPIYRVCAQLENTTGGNRGAAATACSDSVNDGGHGYFCVGNLSE